jgi:hypothetical protein
MRKWIFLGMLALSAVFCTVSVDPGGSPTATPDIGAIVDATLTAAAAGSPTDTPGPTPTETLSPTPMSTFPETGYISGTLMFPSEGVPPLRVVAFPVGGGAPSYTDTVANQSSYTLELAVGTYNVVAYTMDGGFSGGYTHAVPCGLSVDCPDHSLIDVVVTAGATTTDVIPGDFYAPEGSFPPMPSP